MNTLAAIGGLVLLVALMAWAYARSAASAAKSLEQRNALEEGLDARSDFDDAVNTPIPRGAALRERMRERLRRATAKLSSAVGTGNRSDD